LKNEADKDSEVNSREQKSTLKLQTYSVEYTANEQEFENKMIALLPDADLKGIKNLISYAGDLDDDETCKKDMFFTDTFIEFYLVAHTYGQEIACQLLDVCRTCALNPFEIRGAAYNIQSGVPLEEIGQMAVDGLCDPPDGEPLISQEALKEFEIHKLLDDNVSKKAHEIQGKAKPKTVADRLREAAKKVKSQNARHPKTKSRKQDER